MQYCMLTLWDIKCYRGYNIWKWDFLYFKFYIKIFENIEKFA